MIVLLNYFRDIEAARTIHKQFILLFIYLTSSTSCRIKCVVVPIIKSLHNVNNIHNY